MFPPQRVKEENRRIAALLQRSIMILGGIALMYKGAFG
jgi:hypothetical protein